MNLGRLDLPSMSLPDAPRMPVPTLEIPSHEIPRYKPLVLPPSDLRAPPGVKGGVNEKPPPKTKPDTPSEIRHIQVPWTNQEIPVPSTPVLVTAGSTAAVSVGVGMIASAIFKHLVTVFKPIIKKLVTKKKKDE